MGRQKHQPVLMYALDPPLNVVGGAAAHDSCIGIKPYRKLAFFSKQFLQLPGVLSGNRKGRCILRSRNILGIKSPVINLSIAAVLNRKQCRSTL